MENNSDQNTQEQTTASNGSAETASNATPETKTTPDPLAEAQQKYVYLYAEFENYKKRAIKERQDTIKYAIEGPANELLQVLDNLERALQFAKPDGDTNLLEGLKMVMNQLKSTLDKQGIKEIPTDKLAFNPELHEGVGQMPSDLPQNTIVQTHQKGYTLHGRLIRPARVMVSSGPAN